MSASRVDTADLQRIDALIKEGRRQASRRRLARAVRLLDDDGAPTLARRAANVANTRNDQPS